MACGCRLSGSELSHENWVEHHLPCARVFSGTRGRCFPASSRTQLIYASTDSESPMPWALNASIHKLTVSKIAGPAGYENQIPYAFLACMYHKFFTKLICGTNGDNNALVLNLLAALML